MSTPKTTAAPAKSFRLSQEVQDSIFKSEQAFSARQVFTPKGPLPEVPATFKECSELWAELQRLWKIPNLSPLWRERIAQIRRRASELQQGLPAVPNDDHAETARARFAVISSAEARREEEISGLKSALANNFADEPIFPTRQIADALQSFIFTDGNEIALALRTALAKYQIQFNENFSLISPMQRAEERKLKLNSNPTPEQSKRIAEEATLANTPEFKQLCNNARVTLNRVWDAEIKPLEIQLVEGCLKFIAACKDTAIACETEFFALAGLSREATSVSRRFDPLAKELTHELDRLRNGSGATIVAGIQVSHAERSVLTSVFGVPVVF